MIVGMYILKMESRAQKNHHSRHYGGNEGCYLLLVGVSMKNQFGIIGIIS